MISDQSRPHVTLKVYDVLGQEARTLVDEPKEAGYYTVSWDGRDKWAKNVASGVYLYALKAGDYVEIKRMLLLR